jgi:hypothetical protein
MKKLFLLLSSLLFGFVGGGRAALAAGSFNDETILDWQVKVNTDFQRAHPEIVQQALALLTKELQAITTTVPPQRLGTLRRAIFWLDERVPEGAPSARAPTFHPSREWLQQHGLNPDMAGGIELPNAQTFLDSYSWEPWAMMHELAHFYHFTVLGEGYAPILNAYHHARDAHLYESVEHYDGKMMPAYALENEKEYFAELTEAYFGRNDFFPFTRGDLRSYDPTGFALMQEVWEAP